MEKTAHPSRLPRSIILLIALAALAAVIAPLIPAAFYPWLGSRMNFFATVFLGIFVEAVPYLILGTLASGLTEVFLDRDQMSKWISGRPLAASVTGSLMGMVFPVCECGTIPFTRRLFHKGLPLPAGIAFLLAAPVINPIVLFSTAAAFGWGEMLFWRFALTLAIAVATGLIFSVEKDAMSILRPVAVESHAHDHSYSRATASFRQRTRKALLIAADEFFEMGRFLVAGALLAAGLQAFLPQSVLLAIGSGPLLSTLVMLFLAAMLSICSTVDSFVALGFVGAFSFGSILAFLVFGPMVDIKSVMMYLQVLKRRAVFYIVALPLMMSLLCGLIFNYLSP